MEFFDGFARLQFTEYLRFVRSFPQDADHKAEAGIALIVPLAYNYKWLDNICMFVGQKGVFADAWLNTCGVL